VEIKLSIIIPLYNAQDYIVNTVSSVLNGMPKNVELIIVDDGSTDNSVQLIKREFSKQLNTGYVSLLEQQNGGVSVARNTGIEQCKGEYITFVDADDLLFKDYYINVFSVIESESPDIIDIGFRRFSEEKDLRDNPDMFTYNDFGVLNTSDVISNIFSRAVFYSCTRITKKTVLGDLRFPEGVNFCEDMIFLYQLYQRSETIYHINKALYAYRDNADGATRNMKPNYLVTMLSLYFQLLKDRRPEINYLKVNVFYVIYRCSCELGESVPLPSKLFWDSKLLALNMLFQQRFPIRKRLILLAPNIFQLLRRTKKNKKKSG
jgi:glycosyltransferase involved in cell wall biosynthesis